MQNRGYIYDSALAILAYTSAGNFTAAEKVINQLNTFLAAPGYLASMVLENAEDGSTARWSKSGTGATVTNIAANSVSPQEPPYGTGNILDFHSGSANAVFTYTGSGFPDTTDTYSASSTWKRRETGFVFDVGVVTSQGLVTRYSSHQRRGRPGNAGGHGDHAADRAGQRVWRTTLVNLAIANIRASSPTRW